MNTPNSKTSFFFIILLLILTFCPGCSYIQYERNGLKVTGFEFGTDKALSGFSYETPEGRVTVESLDKNQTAGISAIAEGIVKGAIKGAK